MVILIIKQRVENKAPEDNNSDEDTKAYSRCSVPYLFSVFKTIICSEHRQALVKNMGFHHMLQLDDCSVPRLFAQWIANNTIPDSEIIKVGDKSIPLDPQSFVDILGIPAGSLAVESDEESGKLCFLDLFGLSEIPSIRFFGDKIINEEHLPDDEFCRCFMTVVLGAFLCPNSSTKPSTKYMGALIDVDKINDRNWAKFAHEWYMCYVRKYLKEKSKDKKGTLTLGGCIYQAAVCSINSVCFKCVLFKS